MKKLLVILLVLGLAAPAMAQSQWNFYGSLRTHIGYYDADDDYTAPTAFGPAQDGTISAVADDDAGILLSMSAQSRLGFKGAVSDKLFGHVEFGFTETTRAGKSQSPYTRLAYGQWNFGAGSLIFGKHYTPGTFLGYSNMVGDIGDSGDANMLVGGLAYIGRHPQIRLSIANFEIALIEQNTGAPSYAADGYGDIDRILPRVEAAYVFRTPMISIRPVLGYQTYKVENQATSDDKTIDSFLAGLGVSMTFGPAYVKLTGAYQQNPGNYGNTNLVAPAARSAVFVGNSVEDAMSLQGTFVAGFKVSPTFFIEAGLGYTKNEVDVAPGVEQEQDGMVYYLQAPITLAKGFTLIPEVGQVNQGDIELNGTSVNDGGKLTYFVANLRIDF